MRYAVGTMHPLSMFANNVVLPGFLQTVAPLLDSYGYLAVGILLLLEDFGIPVPGETTLIAAAIYAGAGKLNVFLLAFIAIVAAVLGDNIGFAIGHYGGERLVHRYGRYIFLNKEKFARAREFFNRRGGAIVMGARFVEGLRQLNGIIAGSSEMSWRIFLVFNSIGATIWVGSWVALGYLAGDHIATIYKEITRYELYALVAVILLLMTFVVRAIRRHGRRQ